MPTFDFPHLGTREFREDPNELGHHLWLDSFGWHDCTRTEDCLIRGEHPLFGRVTKLPTGMIGIKIDAYTVFPAVRDLIFNNHNLYPGVWLDPIGWGQPMIVGFDDAGEHETFCSLLSEAGHSFELVPAR